MFRFDYTYTDYEQLMHDMAARLHVAVHNDILIFPSAVASGSLEFMCLPNGLHCNLVNCTFNQDWMIHRKKSGEEYYTLRFDEMTIPDTLVVTVDEEKVKEKNTVKPMAYLTSSLFDWAYHGTKGTTFKGINILFNKEWLADYLDIKAAEEVLTAYISLKAENITIEPLDTRYRRWMNTVFETSHNEPLRVAIIQNRVMLMIERFLGNLYKKMHNPALRVPLSPQDINRVMQIESMLTKDVFQPAPSIQELAKIAAISESKLKKDFKTMYGFPIYEYYQKARMLAAQDKLLTGNFSVKEVAMELGYANLSNFTIAFKKEFGVLPSELLQ